MTVDLTGDAELDAAAQLPQLDATTLVDRELLEAEVQEMYRLVADEHAAELHFEIGRELALRLGYPQRLLDLVPPEALASFAGVGRHLDLAGLRPGHRVLDLGSGSGTDVFCAALEVGPDGSAEGVDFTDAQVAKARRLADRDGFAQVAFHEAAIDALPFTDATFEAVISNGVVNLSPVKDRVFAEAARVLKPGGRLALSDIVSARALRERTRRNVDLWAACIAGAVPRTAYLEAIEAAGFSVVEVRVNDYAFRSPRAVEACGTYGVESISLAAVRA
jgi:arsenite methyltransferase